METFLLSACLEDRGYKLTLSQRRKLNEVLIFQDGGLSVSNRDTGKYINRIGWGRLAHKDLLKAISKGLPVEELVKKTIQRKLYTVVTPAEIVRVHYKLEIEDHLTVTETLSPNIDLYRLIHEDAHPGLSLNSLWLAIPEVRAKLDLYLFPVNGETNLVKTAFGTFPEDILFKGMKTAIIGDDNLSLICDLTLEQNVGWLTFKESSKIRMQHLKDAKLSKP